MTILYEGFRGNEPNIILGVILCILGLSSLIWFILSFKDGETESCVISFFGFFIAIVGALIFFTSHRYPIVRATIDDTTSFKEVYESYELIDVEGDIYTFKVKDINE